MAAPAKSVLLLEAPAAPVSLLDAVLVEPVAERPNPEIVSLKERISALEAEVWTLRNHLDTLANREREMEMRRREQYYDPRYYPRQVVSVDQYPWKDPGRGIYVCLQCGKLGCTVGPMGYVSKREVIR